jgi:redox-sensitive bicupin YhaK (pirin superfamily)
MKIYIAMQTGIDGIPIKRVLPQVGCKSVGPFVFFDHIGPASIKANDPGLVVRMHPHIHLITCTYFFEGEIFHSDSVGGRQNLTPGGINWMIAGSGVTHAERSPEHLKGIEYSIHGTQFWLALPEAKEDCEPEFFHFPASEVPRWQEGAAEFALMAGNYMGYSGPCPLSSPTLLMHISIPEGAELRLETREDQTALYCLSGALKYESTDINNGNLAILPDQESVSISAKSSSNLFLLGGTCLGRRYLDWNFVSSKRTSIIAAKEKWKKQGFLKVPGETEFMRYPE